MKKLKIYILASIIPFILFSCGEIAIYGDLFDVVDDNATGAEFGFVREDASLQSDMENYYAIIIENIGATKSYEYTSKLYEDTNHSEVEITQNTYHGGPLEALEKEHNIFYVQTTNNWDPYDTVYFRLEVIDEKGNQWNLYFNNHSDY